MTATYVLQNTVQFVEKYLQLGENTRKTNVLILTHVPISLFKPVHLSFSTKKKHKALARKTAPDFPLQNSPPAQPKQPPFRVDGRLFFCSTRFGFAKTRHRTVFGSSLKGWKIWLIMFESFSDRFQKIFKSFSDETSDLPVFSFGRSTQPPSPRSLPIFA